MNMEQPDPAGLFDQFQGQRQKTPANSSVIAQISNRPAPAGSIPPVTVPPAKVPPAKQQPVAAKQPANPFVALYESGVMEESIQKAQVKPANENPFVALYESGTMEKSIAQSQQPIPEANPFVELYQSGQMSQSVLQAEDQQYKKALSAWEKQDTEPLTGMKSSNFLPSPTAGTLPKPEAPARDLPQIEKDWNLGVHSLRGQEFGKILGQIETGKLSPDQEASITRLIEPVLTPKLKKQLQISRMTRDKYLELKGQYDEQMSALETLGKGVSKSGNPLAWAAEKLGHFSPSGIERQRGVARGASFNYAFAPDKERLNSANPEEVADERAKRIFYQKERAEYPVSSLVGGIAGSALPMAATGSLIRNAKVLQANRALKAGPPTSGTAGVISRGGAPSTTAGSIAEGTAIGLPYDLASRPEGSEEMSLKGNIEARGTQAGFGVALSVAGDLALTKALPALASGRAKVSDVVKTQVKQQQHKRLDKTAGSLGYENFDAFVDAATEIVTDETGSRIRLKQEVLDTLPEEQQATVKQMFANVQQETANVPPTQAPATDQPRGRTEPDSTELTDTGTDTALFPVEEQNQSIPASERLAPGEAEAPVSEGAEPSLEIPEAETPSEHQVTGSQIIEAPVNELSLSEDVPQFKSGANQKGIVEQLGGTFDRTGVGPIQVWVRNDGSKEVISGRHRLDLATRSGEETIPAQYHYESEGFGRDQAATLDAMLNIREGQGKVKDYVDFVQNSELTKEEADAQGILARATGRRAYTIATEGTDTLITAYRADQLTDEAATRIASAAPNNEALQAVGIKAIQDGKSITVAENMVKAVRTMTDDTAITSGDMFGFDDTALKEAEDLARKAAAKQAEIQRTLSAVQGAAKRPDLAAKEGVDVKDPEAVKRRIEDLKQQKQDWQNWHTNPELTAELRGEKASPQTTAEAETEPPPQDSFDLSTQTETELTAKDQTARAAEAARQQEQTDLEAKAKADQEAKEFELGIQGSGSDVSASQTDILGLGGEQPNRQTSLKSESPTEPEPAEIQAEAPETQYRNIANTPDPKQKNLKGGSYTINYHDDIGKALLAGELSIDDFKAAFQALLDNKDDIFTRLNKYKKDNLMGMANRYADKKPEAVQNAFEKLRDRYLLGNDLPSLEYSPFSFDKGARSFEEARLQQEQQIAEIVRNTTQADLDNYAKSVSEHVEKRKAEKADQQTRIENPQTLEDFELAVRENGKESLTTAQRAEYERLNAEAQWQSQEKTQQAKSVKEGLDTEESLVINPVQEGTHSKTGETIYNVKVETKLGKDKFQQAAKTARSMGGGYWKGNFWLKTPEDAEQFTHWLNGQTIDRSAKTMEMETTQATTRADNLRTMADKQEAQGNAELNADRRTNTPKQMNQAASARAQATKKINFANTLRNIANGIEEGSVRFLSKLSNMAQLEELQQIIRRSIPHNMMDSHYNGYSMNTSLKEGVTLEDYIDQIKIPDAQLHLDNAIKLAEELKGKRGYSRLRAELEKQISIAKRTEKRTISFNPHSEYAGLLESFDKKSDFDIGWLYNENMDSIKRLQRMGLTTDDQLRSAIRELEAVKSNEGIQTPTERKLEEMRFKIKQSARGFNDFFPTPEDTTNRVLELADVQPGMKTLEPNAGMGHIAEKLQTAAGKDNVDLVEMSGQLVDYLETAGHKVTQSDFMEYGEADTYDRIVMNPPFSKDQDIDHVMHAYELLKPGGKMTAIMSNMAGLRSNNKNRAFSDWLDEVGAHVEDLEAGAFKSSFNPTSVNTKVVVIDKPSIEPPIKQTKPEATAPPNIPESTPSGTTFYSSPVLPAARQAADLLHLNPAGSVGGGIYGGIYAGDESESEKFSAQWWLDASFGALGGALAGSAGFAGVKGIPIKGKPLIGKQSWGKEAYNFMGKQIRKLPGMSRGDEDVLAMGKQQRLMKALIERQAEQAGEYLLKNFTPEERSVMADLIEQRGIVAEGNLLHRQAKELDDFIGYTSKKLQDLGMLDDTIEPGGYLHRYYSKHLSITGLAQALTPKGKGISGTWSIRRGTQEVFDSHYMSQSMRDTMQQVQALKDEYDGLKPARADLIDADTQARMDEIKAQMHELQSVQFREYLAPENGTLKSFFLADDEVPLIPGLKNRAETGLPEPVRQESLEGISEPPKTGTTGELVLTDRRWTIDGMKEDGNGILHRDWTKAERESWGEINDAAYRMVRGQAEVAHDLSLGTFFKQVNDRFEGSKVSDTEIEGWIKVPDTKVTKGGRIKKYGALSGKYVTKDIWQAVRNHGRNPMLNFFNNHPAVAGYLKALGKWKAYKTVYNPVSHINNSVSNLQMYYLSDYENRYLAQAFSELRKGESSELVREANNNGLFGNDWTSEITGETGQKAIDQLLEKIRTQPDIPDFEQSLDTMMSLKQWYIESSHAVKGAQGPWKTGAELAKAIGNPMINTAKKPINKAADAMQKAYRMEDEFFKMAIYMAERQKGTKPFEAVQAANQYFFDYNDMPDAMKWVRDFPIGSPFVSYTYFAIPAIVRTAVEKPEKILALTAALEGINYASMALNGELQDQGYWDRMADENELYPSWMQGRSIWGGLNNVSIPFLESYKLGLANANVVGNPLAGQVERSEGWPSFLSFWGAGWYGSNPITTMINDITNNEDWRGNPIWSEGAPTSEQVRKATNYVYQNLAPSNPLFPGSYHQQKNLEGMANQVRSAEEAGEQPNVVVGGIVDLANAVSESLGGTQFTGLDRRGNEILARDSLWGSVGFKTRPVRIDQFADSKYWGLNQEIDELRKWGRNRERLYEENRLTEKQIEKDRDYMDSQFIKLEEREGRLEQALKSQLN